MSSVSTQCPKCGKRYRLSADAAPRKIRCRDCQTVFPLESHDSTEEEELPTLPTLPRRKKTKAPRSPDAEGESAGATSDAEPTRSPSRARNPVFATTGVITLIFWLVIGVGALIPGLGKWMLVALVPHGFLLLAWGMAGVSLVAQEENEMHGIICWSTFLLFLSPFVPCIALVSLIGLILIMFYGLSRLPKTGWYVLMILVALAELTIVGATASQVKF